MSSRSILVVMRCEYTICRIPSGRFSARARSTPASSNFSWHICIHACSKHELLAHKCIQVHTCRTVVMRRSRCNSSFFLQAGVHKSHRIALHCIVSCCVASHHFAQLPQFQDQIALQIILFLDWIASYAYYIVPNSCCMASGVLHWVTWCHTVVLPCIELLCYIAMHHITSYRITELHLISQCIPL